MLILEHYLVILESGQILGRARSEEPRPKGENKLDKEIEVCFWQKDPYGVFDCGGQECQREGEDSR